MFFLHGELSTILHGLAHMTYYLYIFPSFQLSFPFCGPTVFCIGLYCSIAHTREYIIYEDISLLNCDHFKDGNCALLSLLPPLNRTETGIQQAEPSKCWLSNWVIYSDVAGVAHFWISSSLSSIWYYILCMCISGTSCLMKWLNFLNLFLFVSLSKRYICSLQVNWFNAQIPMEYHWLPLVRQSQNFSYN